MQRTRWRMLESSYRSCLNRLKIWILILRTHNSLLQKLSKEYQKLTKQIKPQHFKISQKSIQIITIQ